MFIYIYAFLVLGLLNSFKDIAIKHSLKNINTGVLAGLTSIFTILISLPFLYIEGIPEKFPPNFIWAFLFGGIFYYFGKFFSFTALKLGDISLIAPMRGLIVFSVTISSILLLGETVSLLGGLGLFLTILGTYLLAVEKTHTNILAPIKALLINKGSRIYLLSIFFYGLTTTIDRIGVLGSSVWFWTISMNLFIFIFSLPDVIKNRKTIISSFKNLYLSFIFIVFSHSIIYISQIYVLSKILAPYTSSLRNSSALFSVIIGGWFFKEKGLVKKFISALIILLGVVLISFYG